MSGRPDTPFALGGIAQAGSDVILCERREVVQDFLLRHPGGEIGEHVVDGDAQATDGRLAASLARLKCDDILI